MVSKFSLTQRMRLVVGTYTETMPHVVGKGSGVSLLGFDPQTGKIEPLASCETVRNPTYLALSRDRQRIHGVEELEDAAQAGMFVLHLNAGNDDLSLALRVPALAGAPCHIALDEAETAVFVSNYAGGSVTTYGLGDDGLPKTESGTMIQRHGSGSVEDRQEGPHVHQVVPTPDGRHVLVCDLGTDEIARYPLHDGGMGAVPDISFRCKPGSLPRHMSFSADGRYLYVANERSNTVATYAYGEDGPTFLDEVSTLPSDFSGRSHGAAIKLHPDGRFLYVSNRGHDSIAIFEIQNTDGRLQLTDIVAAGGSVPRDFAIDPTGRFLVAANQDSHSLTCFEIDAGSGRLSPLAEPFDLGSPVCVLFV